MKKKKVAIIGRGTAGCMAAAFFNKHTSADVEWYFDSNIRPQAVGEGSNLVLPKRLNECLNFSYRDMPLIDGTIKTGIYKENWGQDQAPFMHDFPSPHVALHFNANKLQDYVHSKLSSEVSVIDRNVSSGDVDADFILDCSGTPKDFSDCVSSEYIPVNAAYVTQCYWDYPRFDYTLTIARPYGWVFGIPLKNRCSIGYLYNSNINTEEEVVEDVLQVMEQYGLTPSSDTNKLSFKNYRRSDNFKGNVAYSGNASFFLEPIEATSFSTSDAVNVAASLHWFNGTSKEHAQLQYDAILDANESIIMLHYAAGSKFKTPFWDYATERGRLCIENSSDAFKYMLSNISKPTASQTYTDAFTYPSPTYLDFHATHSAWWEGSFAQNVEGLFGGSYPNVQALKAA